MYYDRIYKDHCVIISKGHLRDTLFEYVVSVYDPEDNLIHSLTVDMDANNYNGYEWNNLFNNAEKWIDTCLEEIS